VIRRILHLPELRSQFRHQGSTSEEAPGLPVPSVKRLRREALKRAFHDGKLNFHGDLKLLAQPKTFAAWLRPLFRNNWVVYSKRPF
jgi:hypothetical protein